METRGEPKILHHPWAKCNPWVPVGVLVARLGGVLKVRRRVAGRSTTTQMEILGSRRGFTLLEVLVSLSIVAIAVTIVLQLFSSGLRAIATSEDNAAAVIKAETKMREVLDNDELAETSWSEATPDGYRMDISIIDTLKERTDNLKVRLMQVALTTRWFKGNKEKTLTLRTMKLVNKVAPGTTGTAGAMVPKTPGGTAAPAGAPTGGPTPGVTPGTAGPRM